MMNFNKLPADPTALVLGIIGIVVAVFGCCCGIGSVISLALCIIGLVQAQKSLREYAIAPENYSVKTKDTVVAGKIVCIIGIVLSALFTMIFVIYFAVVGTMMSDEVWRKWEEGKSERNEIYIDSTYNEVEIDTTSTNSSYQDSIIIKEVK